ncbi:anthranilate synthase component I family protein [Microbispora amethystogenes]|uniref:anthranilate synthase component I family protein n=1 Tax=Microbispora amethystogenes TaxID=1427754 RepID=UPI0033D4A94E
MISATSAHHAQTTPLEGIRQRRTEVSAVDAFGAYAALRATYGPDDIFLLESLGGPDADRRMAVIGMFPILSLSVRGGEVDFDGYPLLREICRSNAVAAGAVTESADGCLQLTRWNSLWPLLRSVRDEFTPPPGDRRDGFGFGFFGYFGYDAAWSLERLPRLIENKTDLPEVCLMVHQVVIIVDIENNRATLVVNEGGPLPSVDETVLRDVRQTLEGATGTPEPPAAPPPAEVRDSIGREEFCAAVRSAQEYIAAGDVYQVQFGHELTVHSEIDPFDVYLRLRARNPSPYMYVARVAGRDIVGASPELCVRVEGGRATLRPIAGTIRRGGDRAQDGSLTERLTADPKEQAEHLMLVDLCRNDLARVCVPATLNVDEYMVPELYSHLIHLVSNVTAVVDPRHDAFDVLAAAFPAGTMTGAPKIRAMEIIEELETARRGIYAGTIGLIDFGGYVNTALAIRTAVHVDGRYFLRASAGIVADSRPESEWRETIDKLSAPYWAVTGEELALDHSGR